MSIEQYERGTYVISTAPELLDPPAIQANHCQWEERHDQEREQELGSQLREGALLQDGFREREGRGTEARSLARWAAR